MPTIDLTPFGFTPTESLTYATLLHLGPATGYAVARAARLARANAYGALEGLVARGAASRALGGRPGGRPARYRPTDPQALLAQLATLQGQALDRLAEALRDAARGTDPVTREIAGARAVANLIVQLVARAERRVAGVLAADLWRPTVPAWRRAVERAAVELRIAGDLPADPPAWLARDTRPAAEPTVLIIDGAHLVCTRGAGDAVAGVWSAHPLLLLLGERALESPP